MRFSGTKLTKIKGQKEVHCIGRPLLHLGKEPNAILEVCTGRPVESWVLDSHNFSQKPFGFI